jgi:hypothetical protein
VGFEFIGALLRAIRARAPSWNILRIGLPLCGKVSVRERLQGEARVHDSGRFWHILQAIWRVAPVTGMEKWDRVCLVGTARQRATQPILNQICTMSKFWFITGTACGLRGAGCVGSSDRFEIAAARTGLSSASTHREHL